MAQGFKISELPELPTITIEDGDLYEVVRDGENYKIAGSVIKTVIQSIAGTGGSGGGIPDVPDTTTGGKKFVRTSRIGASGIWEEITIPNPYVLPTASDVVLGGVKIGSGLSMNSGIMSVTAIPDTSGSPSTYAGTVKVDGTTIIAVNGVLTAYGSSGGGSVISVGLALPNIFSVSGSPVTTSGTLTGTLTTQAANTVFAGPASGSAVAPSFRALVLADLPSITSAELASKISDETGSGALVFANSPSLSGNPTAPTQSSSDNSTKLATTAFVKAALSDVSFNWETSTSNIKMNGAASVGTATTVPRADHVHPVDTSRASKNGSSSENFTAATLTCSALVLNGHTLTIE